ncbi:MAG: caspase family protein [Planctomycetaceae bacterium]|nr:caspase family protein [Planctomycetaceae bacterium]
MVFQIGESMASKEKYMCLGTCKHLFGLMFLLISGLVAVARADDKALSVTETLSSHTALIIGVDHYEHFRSLEFCGNDSRDLADRLRHAGIDKDRVVTMTGSVEDSSMRPTAINIRRQLNHMLGALDEEQRRIVQPGTLRPGDMFVFAFSGHGVHIDGVSYLCPSDGDLRNRESLIPVPELYRQMELCGARFRLCLIDACRNEPLPSGARDVHESPIDQKQLPASLLRSPPEGMLVLASCAAGQISYEDPELRHGVFMNYVLEGLSGAADANGDGQVTVLEICSYSSDSTTKYVHKTRHTSQTPEFNGRLVNSVLVTVDPASHERPNIVRTISYSMHPATVRTGDLPKGWSGDESVASQKTPSGPALIQLTPQAAVLSFDELQVASSFFVEFEYYLGGWYSSFECTLTGDSAQDILLKSAHPGGNTNCVASLNGFPAKQIGGNLNDYKHKARIEVQDRRLRLLIDGIEIQAIRWEEKCSYGTARFVLSTQDERHYAAAHNTALLSFRSGPLTAEE